MCFQNIAAKIVRLTMSNYMVCITARTVTSEHLICLHKKTEIVKRTSYPELYGIPSQAYLLSQKM